MNWRLWKRNEIDQWAGGTVLYKLLWLFEQLKGVCLLLSMCARKDWYVFHPDE
jgi:hypothetical protein